MARDRLYGDPKIMYKLKDVDFCHNCKFPVFKLGPSLEIKKSDINLQV